MRIFVAGASGQLARALRARAGDCGHVVGTFGRPELDLASASDPATAIAGFAADIVINAAAYTAVDRAEAEPELAFAVNRDGAVRLAAAARRLGLPFLHVSTDYVFDGGKGAPYAEGDATAPLGIYGRSKLEGEAAVRAAHPDALVFRTSWVYGADGGNFVRTMVRLASERDKLDIVADRFGNPTFAADLADGLLAIAGQAGNDRGGGIFHLAGADDASWHDLAGGVMAALAAAGRPVPALSPISGDAYVAAAARPGDSRLDGSLAERTFGVRLPGWRASVGVAVSAILAQQEAIR
jgi:dTDP-4-dehydrorhamnose reductase